MKVIERNLVEIAIAFQRVKRTEIPPFVRPAGELRDAGQGVELGRRNLRATGETPAGPQSRTRRDHRHA